MQEHAKPGRATYQDVAPPHMVAVRGALHLNTRPNGVSAPWLVDPIARTLEGFAFDGTNWVMGAAQKDGAEARVPPFEAMTFPLARLWAD